MITDYFKTAANVLLASVFILSSCQKEDTPAETEHGNITMSIRADAFTEISAWTKSYASESVENKLVYAALGIYDSYGRLIYSDKVEGEFSGFDSPVSLHSDQSYKCYMVTGYIASVIEFPQNENQLQSLVIENTTTDSTMGEHTMEGTLDDYGLDRAGSTDRLTPAGLDSGDGVSDGIITIPLKSLWAKVDVALDCSELSDVEITSDNLQLCGAGYGNRDFAPFAENGCRTTTDRLAALPLAKKSPDRGDGMSHFVFYVPENRLGDLLPGNENMDLKIPETVSNSHGSTLGSIVEKCAVELRNSTYTDWGQRTFLYYRFCLGCNPYSNFDIIGGNLYNITIRATKDGYKIKEWKSEYNFSDNRSISLKGISAYCRRVPGTLKFTTRFQMEDLTVCSPGQTVYLLTAYKEGSTNSTNARFNTTHGWKISESSRRMMDELGISYSLKNLYVYAIDGMPEIYYSTSPGISADLGTTIITLEGTRTASTLLELSVPESVAGGVGIPITVETYDGAHSANVTVQTKADGSLTPSWKNKATYIAQRGEIEAKNFTGLAASASFSVKAGSEGYIEVSDNGNNSCSVSLLKAGNAYVHYVGLGSNGKTVCQGDFPVSISAPEMASDPAVYQLSPGGDATSAGYRYTGSGGVLLTRASENGKGYGTYFEPSLFDRLLVPTLSLAGSEADGFLSCSDEGVFVSSLSSGDREITDLLDKVVPDALVLTPPSKDVAAATAGVKIVSPLGEYGEDRFICCIDNHSFSGGSGKRTSSSIVVRPGNTASLPAGTLDLKDYSSSYSIEDLPDMSFSVSESGSVSVSGKTSSDRFSAGKKILYFCCKNFRSGESMRLAAGYMEVYLHLRPGAYIDLSSASPKVTTDIKNHGLVAAAASLREGLKAGKGCIKSTFSRGGYYSLGYGRWNYTDEFDEQGNQYVAPEQNYLMTEFLDNTWQQPVKLGAVAYTIYPGVLERNAGVYDSFENFVSDNPTPPLALEAAGFDFLCESPFNKRMYHYNADGAMCDGDGYSYFILDSDDFCWLN